ncbi:hypothetical protein [Synechococcus sp. CBW1006]|uniref:hypothetical protein n=1 Tax=Synechococcus sp. CBW1006 TaxID=1353138 RepID=UPI0018CDF836|nr:hypothetical protein [Synechococcus sp. CBW1006]QPN66571.1 hypothetical protein H8F26_17910 [Synechococcus sp. CBW1006]
MAAFFSTFTASEPDDDGDIITEVELTITNGTPGPIHRIYFRSLLLGDQDACFEGVDSYEDAFLAPAESSTISLGSSVNQREVQESSISIKATGQLCRRDYALLGELPIPEPGESMRLHQQPNFDWCNKSLTVFFSRTETDSDGDFNLEYKCLIGNVGTQHLKSVIFRAVLIDSEGIEIEDKEHEEEIQAESSIFISDYFYRPKASQLVGGKVIFSIKALVPVERFEASETTSLADD